MDKNRQILIKKIAKLSSISFLVMIIGFLIYYLISFVADDGGIISNIEVSNISTNSFTVTWVTSRPTISEIIVSDSENFIEFFPRWTSNARFFFDERDGDFADDGSFVYESNDLRTQHFVTVRNVDPETEYFFRILGSFKAFKAEKSEYAVVRTFGVSDSFSLPIPVMSRAINGDDPENFLPDIFLVGKIFEADVDGNSGISSQQFATLVNNVNGGWQIDLANLRTASGVVYTWDLKRLHLSGFVYNSGGAKIIDLSQPDFRILFRGDMVLDNIIY